MKRLCLSALWFLAVACASSAAGELPPIAVKARQYVGTEAALAGVTSVHFVGRLETTERTKDGSRPVVCDIELIFQKPSFQKMILTTDRLISVRGLDGAESWQSDESRADGSRVVQFPPSREHTRRVQASVWENLNFFTEPPPPDGRIEDGGLVEKDGSQLHKVSYHHGHGIVYVRYFDPQTGQLKISENANSTISEDGFLTASGIRFPKTLITTDQFPDGTKKTIKITFDKVTVNTPFPRETFQAPASQLGRRRGEANQPP